MPVKPLYQRHKSHWTAKRRPHSVASDGESGPPHSRLRSLLMNQPSHPGFYCLGTGFVEEIVCS